MASRQTVDLTEDLQETPHIETESKDLRKQKGDNTETATTPNIETNNTLTLGGGRPEEATALPPLSPHLPYARGKGNNCGERNSYKNHPG